MCKYMYTCVQVHVRVEDDVRCPSLVPRPMDRDSKGFTSSILPRAGVDDKWATPPRFFNRSGNLMYSF